MNTNPPVEAVALDALIRYHETGGHEGDGSDETLAKAREELAVLTRTPTPLPKLTGDAVEAVAKAHAFARRSRHDQARDADHYWQNTSTETQEAELQATRAALAAMPAPPLPDHAERDQQIHEIADAVAKGCRYKAGSDNYSRVWQGAIMGARKAFQSLSTPPDARAKVIEEGPANLFSRLLRWRDAEAAAAEARGEPMFMGKPDAWYEDTHWFCANGHVSARFLKSERGDLCLACQAPAFLGPKIGETAFALIRTRLRALSPSGQSGGGE